jgi:hypothetical protein
VAPLCIPNRCSRSTGRLTYILYDAFVVRPLSPWPLTNHPDQRKVRAEEGQNNSFTVLIARIVAMKRNLVLTSPPRHPHTPRQKKGAGATIEAISRGVTTGAGGTADGNPIVGPAFPFPHTKRSTVTKRNNTVIVARMKSKAFRIQGG